MRAHVLFVRVPVLRLVQDVSQKRSSEKVRSASGGSLPGRRSLPVLSVCGPSRGVAEVALIPRTPGTCPGRQQFDSTCLIPKTQPYSSQKRSSELLRCASDSRSADYAPCRSPSKRGLSDDPGVALKWGLTPAAPTARRDVSEAIPQKRSGVSSSGAWGRYRERDESRPTPRRRWPN